MLRAKTSRFSHGRLTIKSNGCSRTNIAGVTWNSATARPSFSIRLSMYIYMMPGREEEETKYRKLTISERLRFGTFCTLVTGGIAILPRWWSVKKEMASSCRQQYFWYTYSNIYYNTPPEQYLKFYHPQESEYAVKTPAMRQFIAQQSTRSFVPGLDGRRTYYIFTWDLPTSV